MSVIAISKNYNIGPRSGVNLSQREPKFGVVSSASCSVLRSIRQPMPISLGLKYNKIGFNKVKFNCQYPSSAHLASRKSVVQNN